MGKPIITKSIIGHEGKYEINSNGEIWSLDYNRTGTKRKLSGVSNGHGYYQVAIKKSGEPKKRFMVHRLVAIAFIDNPDGKTDVNHKNGIKTDNCVDNLEWVTRRENIAHAIDVLDRKYNRKLSRDDVIEIMNLISNTKLSMGDIARRYSVTASNISAIHNSRSWNRINKLSKGDSHVKQGK